MKQIFAGIIIGALIMSAVPVKAAIEEFILYKANYSLVIGGTEYADAELPLLNYKGHTYAPIRSVFEAAGLKVGWNAEIKQATVTEVEPKLPSETEPTEPTKPASSEPDAEPIANEPTEGDPEPTEPENNDAQIAALTATYNSDIAAIERERSTALGKAITDYEISVYNLIKMGVNAQISQMQINAITANVNNQYQPQIDARTAQYNADLAALQ